MSDLENKAVQKEYEKDSFQLKDADNISKRLSKEFNKTSLVILSENIVKILKEENWIKVKDLQNRIGATKTQMYSTVLPRMKAIGMVKKSGLGIELSSDFSLRNIKEAREWIEITKTKRSQPEQLKEILYELIR